MRWRMYVKKVLGRHVRCLIKKVRWCEGESESEAASVKHDLTRSKDALTPARIEDKEHVNA